MLETIQRSAEFLARKGVESPRLHAELLLAHVLHLPRMRLYLDFERPLTSGQIDELRELVKRRSRREPLQHIIGTASFCGLDLFVNRAVLVPRPETEILAELGWGFLNLVAAGHSTTSSQTRSAPPSVLDFGTGSGCLAITLALKCPTAVVYALDVSPEALAVAGRNAALHGLAERVVFVRGDGLDALPTNARFDLIISNPPYIPTAEIASLQPEVRDFDPRQALDGGLDGLDHYRVLAAKAGAWLHPEGRLMLEFGDGQSESVRQLLTQQNWIVERLVEDYTHRCRIVIAQNKSKAPAESVAIGPVRSSNR